MADPSIPQGFHRHDRRSGLTDPWEPIYIRHHEDGISLAIRATSAHTNSRGFVHGGLISALADNAMGLSCVHGGAAGGLVTVSLNMDFVGAAQIGQWIEFRAQVIKAGKSLSFASALVLADGSICARASSVFKGLSKPAPTAPDSRK